MFDIKPYKTHRAAHLAEMLNTLAGHGELAWGYTYDADNSRALFVVTLPGGHAQTLLIGDAEKLVQSVANKLRIIWIPVLHRGGKGQYEIAKATMYAMKRGEVPKPWE